MDPLDSRDPLRRPLPSLVGGAHDHGAVAARLGGFQLEGEHLVQVIENGDLEMLDVVLVPFDNGRCPQFLGLHVFLVLLHDIAGSFDGHLVKLESLLVQVLQVLQISISTFDALIYNLLRIGVVVRSNRRHLRNAILLFNVFRFHLLFFNIFFFSRHRWLILSTTFVCSYNRTIVLHSVRFQGGSGYRFILRHFILVVRISGRRDLSLFSLDHWRLFDHNWLRLFRADYWSVFRPISLGKIIWLKSHV